MSIVITINLFEYHGRIYFIKISHDGQDTGKRRG